MRSVASLKQCGGGHVYPTLQEEGRGSEVQHPSQLHREFETSWSHTQPCLTRGCIPLNKPLIHTRKANHITNLYSYSMVGILLELGYMEISFLTSLHYCRRKKKVNGILSNKLSKGDLLRKIGAAQKLCRVSLGMVWKCQISYTRMLSRDSLVLFLFNRKS